MRVMSGTILGGVLGFYVMHRVEASYKARPIPRPALLPHPTLCLALLRWFPVGSLSVSLACRRGWRRGCRGTRRICSPRPRRRSRCRTRRSGRTRPSSCPTRDADVLPLLRLLFPELLVRAATTSLPFRGPIEFQGLIPVISIPFQLALFSFEFIVL